MKYAPRKVYIKENGGYIMTAPSAEEYEVMLQEHLQQKRSQKEKTA